MKLPMHMHDESWVTNRNFPSAEQSVRSGGCVQLCGQITVSCQKHFADIVVDMQLQMS